MEYISSALFKQVRSNIPLPFAAFLGFAGSALCVWGFFAAWRSERRFLRSAARASGVVESLVPGSGPRSGWFPVIRFTTADGSSVSAQSRSTRSGYRVGQRVKIDYDPTDPSRVEINSWWSHWAALGVFAFFAVFLLWLGVNSVQQMASR